MAFKKDENGNRIFSEKQQAVLLYGQRLRGLGSVGELIKHLTELGYADVAREVKGATIILKSCARDEYIKERRRLDPEYTTPMQEWEKKLKLQEEKRNERDTTSKTSQT